MKLSILIDFIQTFEVLGGLEPCNIFFLLIKNPKNPKILIKQRKSLFSGLFRWEISKKSNLQMQNLIVFQLLYIFDIKITFTIFRVLFILIKGSIYLVRYNPFPIIYSQDIMKFKCAVYEDARNSSQYTRLCKEKTHPMQKSACEDDALVLKDPQKSIFYEKIKPLKQTLDFESILADYHETKKVKSNQKTVLREKKKELNKQDKQNKLSLQISSGAVLSSEFKPFSTTFQQTLRESFIYNLNGLQKYRTEMMTILFNCLCYGFQQISQKCKKDKVILNDLNNIRLEDLTKLLQHKVFKIDEQLTRQLNGKQEQIVKVTLEGRWKFIIGMLAEMQNFKFRQAIIAGEIKPEQLVYPEQSYYLKYLSENRQKVVKNDMRKILFEGNPWEKQNFEEKVESHYEDCDSRTTTLTSDHQVPTQQDKPQRSSKRSKPAKIQKRDFQELSEVKAISSAKKRRKPNSAQNNKPTK